MPVRGIRGATVVAQDRADLIIEATRHLLLAMVERNDLAIDDVASIIFTVTPDITREYAARAARTLGWHDVALLGATETHVPGSLERCIRVLVHVNTDRSQSEFQHVYLGDAVSLRPDLEQRAASPE
jgi:chorismate mutase